MLCRSWLLRLSETVPRRSMEPAQRKLTSNTDGSRYGVLRRIGRFRRSSAALWPPGGRRCAQAPTRPEDRSLPFLRRCLRRSSRGSGFWHDACSARSRRLRRGSDCESEDGGESVHQWHYLGRRSRAAGSHALRLALWPAGQFEPRRLFTFE